jgi:mannan endo-1,4-beta-mannosidase
VSIAAIASGRYDRYLNGYAKAVAAYRRPVILSFGHEMNGKWNPWGYQHTPPRVFVAAWRHIVTLFRALGAKNVTWMWTINRVHPPDTAVAPAAWWPGAKYVTWVGIDGYFGTRSVQFASLFGPTVVAVRELTRDPILIAETGATATVGQASKIAELFAGVRMYRLLGFLWFDAVAKRDYRIVSPAAITAYREGAAAEVRLARLDGSQRGR